MGEEAGRWRWEVINRGVVLIWPPEGRWQWNRNPSDCGWEWLARPSDELNSPARVSILIHFWSVLNATIDAGDGNDERLIAQSNVGYFLDVFLGAGDDSLEVTESDARAAYLFGGLGVDELDVDAPTLATVDFLLRTEFEI